MKKILYLLLLLPSLHLFSQAPQRINYQSVVRNASGNPLANQAIALRFTIHNGTANGNVIYSETANTTTNQFGLATLEIGAGGNLSLVNWSNGARYLQVDLDPNGGTNFTPMDTSQLLSVPYALFAGNNMAGPTGATGATGPTGIIGATGATGLQGNNGGGSQISFPGTQVFNGFSPVGYWQTLDLSGVVGASKAQVVLKLTNTTGSSASVPIDFRTNGDTAVFISTSGSTSNKGVLGATMNEIATCLICTDNNGRLSWRSISAQPIKVDVVSFIK